MTRLGKALLPRTVLGIAGRQVASKNTSSEDFRGAAGGPPNTKPMLVLVLVLGAATAPALVPALAVVLPTGTDGPARGMGFAASSMSLHWQCDLSTKKNMGPWSRKERGKKEK